MSKIEIKNAKIEGTHLGYEDHGIMTAFLYLDYGDGVHQGFGGYCLKNHALDIFINRVLKVVGVSRWEDLLGHYIRAKSDWGKVYEIGNLLEDKWFNPSEEFKELEKE